MGDLRDALLRSGLASQEQVQKAESEDRQTVARRRFDTEKTWRNFQEAYPIFKEVRGLPPDTPVEIYPMLDYMRLWVRWPFRGELETGYGSPYIGTTLVARVESGQLEKIPIGPEHSDLLAMRARPSKVRADQFLVVEQHLRDVVIYVRLD